MVWVTISDEDKPILKEIEAQTDRGAVLIATAYLEERLLAAIKARIVRSDDVENKVFRGQGPLRSFSARIDVGFLLGIYDDTVRKMLHTIRDIRNDFAHVSKPINFSTQRITALCDNISLAAHVQMLNKTTGETIEFKLEPDGTTRTAFMNAVKYLLLVADMETKQLPLRAPHAPLLPPPQQLPPS